MPLPDARFIDPVAGASIDSIVVQIQGDPGPALVVLGSYEPPLAPFIKSLCSRAIIPAAVNCGAAIIDNGENSGCAALVGQAKRDQEAGSRLIGIASHDTQPEPNHSVIVRLPVEWPEPTNTMLQIAGALAKDREAGEKPVMVILFGGALAEKEALIRCARRGWPILIVRGTGGMADQILDAMDPAADGKPPAPAADPDVREIIETADIDRFSVSGNLDDLSRILMSRIDQRVDTLADGWNRYDDLDDAAIKKQNLFRRMQRTILGLGVFATVLAIAASGTALSPRVKQLFPPASVPLLQWWAHFLIVLTPISISVLVAANSRFREGNKWILLRASAEAVKREIFRYRMQAGAYSDEQCLATSRESKLAAKLKDVSSALVQSEVNRTSLPSAAPKTETARLKFLKPADYINERIHDQIGYFVQKTAALYKRLKRVQVWIYVIGGTGTLLAAFNGDVWVALTTSIAAALTTRLEMDQVENTLVQYNQALTGLRNIVSWWTALSAWEKGRRTNIDLLVDQTEKTLEGELAGWVQQMETALDKLTEKEQPAAADEKARTATA